MWAQSEGERVRDDVTQVADGQVLAQVAVWAHCTLGLFL